MVKNQDVRWVQRFQNFSRAFDLLTEMVEGNDITLYPPIIKEGIIQRFEYTFELAWKTLKDKMLEDGIVIDRISPKFVFKTAFQANYIGEIEEWLKMTNDRNLMSHTYDFSSFDEVLNRVQDDYFPLLQELNALFVQEAKDLL